MPHVQHDCFSSFNQLYHCFLASSSPLRSTYLKLPIHDEAPDWHNHKKIMSHFVEIVILCMIMVCLFFVSFFPMLFLLKAHVHPKDIARLCCCFKLVPAFWLDDFRIFRLCNIQCSTHCFSGEHGPLNFFGGVLVAVSLFLLKIPVIFPNWFPFLDWAPVLPVQSC